MSWNGTASESQGSTFFNNTAEEVDYYARESKPVARTGLRVPAGRDLDPLRRRVEDELLRVE